MCETSNRPTASRTALCSLIVPAGYETGMCQPAKSTSFAPSFLCASQSGVFLGSIAAETTSRDEPVLARHGRIAHPAAELEVCTALAFEHPVLPPGQPGPLVHGDPRVADLGVRAEHLGAVGIEVRRRDHLVGPAGQLTLDLDRGRPRRERDAAVCPAAAISDDMAELVESVLLPVQVERDEHSR